MGSITELQAGLGILDRSPNPSAGCPKALAGIEYYIELSMTRMGGSLKPNPRGLLGTHGGSESESRELSGGEAISGKINLGRNRGAIGLG